MRTFTAAVGARPIAQRGSRESRSSDARGGSSSSGHAPAERSASSKIYAWRWPLHEGKQHMVKGVSTACCKHAVLTAKAAPLMLLGTNPWLT